MHTVVFYGMSVLNILDEYVFEVLIILFLVIDITLLLLSAVVKLLCVCSPYSGW